MAQGALDLMLLRFYLYSSHVVSVDSLGISSVVNDTVVLLICRLL